MNPGVKVLIYPVRDLERETDLFRKLLGAEPYVSEPYYVGFRVGDLEIGLDPNGHRHGMTGPTPFWQVQDIRAKVEELSQAGASVHAEVQDVGGGRLVATLLDEDGNPIGVMQDSVE